MTSLTQKAKDLDWVLGNKEWLMIKEMCPVIDELVRKVNGPTYGPMIEDKEEI